jgi:CspA family cold shock protein
MPDSKRLQGEVKWFNNVRGFGFISAQSVDRDVFVRCRNTPKDNIKGTRRLLEGQLVSFELGITGNKGYEALDVTIDDALVL